LQATLGVLGMAVAAASVLSAAADLQHAERGAGSLMVVGLRLTYPTLNAAGGLLLALAALGVGVLWLALTAGARQRSAYRRFMRNVNVVGSVKGHGRASVIEGTVPQAFCAGYLRPAIYVSRRTVELLAEDELQAVLAHEEHHLRVRDPLRIAVTRMLGRALFFLPIMRPLGDRYGELAEMNADDAAVRASRGRRGALASALLAFDDSSPSHAAGISNERVDRLLGRPRSWRIPVTPMTISLLTLVTLSVLMWRAGELASAHASLNLPVLSARPCIAVLSVMALLGLRRISRRNADSVPRLRRRWAHGACTAADVVTG
jgi:hypothetical protein